MTYRQVGQELAAKKSRNWFLDRTQEIVAEALTSVNSILK